MLHKFDVYKVMIRFICFDVENCLGSDVDCGFNASVKSV